MKVEKEMWGRLKFGTNKDFGHLYKSYAPLMPLYEWAGKIKQYPLKDQLPPFSLSCINCRSIFNSASIPFSLNASALPRKKISHLEAGSAKLVLKTAGQLLLFFYQRKIQL